MAAVLELVSAIPTLVVPPVAERPRMRIDLDLAPKGRRILLTTVGCCLVQGVLSARNLDDYLGWHYLPLRAKYHPYWSDLLARQQHSRCDSKDFAASDDFFLSPDIAHAPLGETLLLVNPGGVLVQGKLNEKTKSHYLEWCYPPLGPILQS